MKPEKETTATEFQQAELKQIEKSKILTESVAEAKQIVDAGKTPTKSWDDTFKSEFVSGDAVEEMYKKRGEKYIENTIKSCITMPYLILTNQQVLKEHLDKYEQEIDLIKKNKIAEDIFATITQIKQLTAQLEAHNNISEQYIAVLKKLQSELLVE